MKNSHIARVGSLAWNDHILTSGSRDTTIVNHDVRIRDPIVSKLEGHTQEVCGLKWSLSGQQLASGGNDNLLHIWDKASCTGSGRPQFRHRLDGHLAAVKALAWCPFQANLLASGGGTADRCIRFWNTHTGALINSIDTHSQVRDSLKRLPLICFDPHQKNTRCITWLIITFFFPSLRGTGLLSTMVAAREGNSILPRLLPKPAMPVEIPKHGEDCRTDRALC